MNSRSSLPRWTMLVLGTLSLVFLSIGVSSPLAAQEGASQQAAASSADDDLPPLPQSPIERAQKDGTALPLSLKELTKLALQNNLDIAIQDTNEELSQLKIAQSYGSYDPTLRISLGTSSTKSANVRSTETGEDEYQKNNSAQWNFTFTKPVQTGGQIQAQWNSNRSDSNLTQNLFNPRYNSRGTISFTQPLLRNFKIDSTRAQIKIANLDLKTSDSQFKQRVTDTISNIQTQYWNLVLAIQDYNIRRDSVRLAQITLRDNKKKVEVGTLAPIEITDAEANMAQREVDLIAAEENILSQQNALRALISNDRNSEIWSQVIVPTDKPDFQEYNIDLSTAIDTALANRPELEQSDISLTKIDVNRRLLENNRKWTLDFTVSYGSNGDAGRFLKAYDSLFGDGFTNWNVGFDLQIPLRSRSMDAQIAQQKIQRQQELMRRKQTEQNIQVDVRNAVQQLETRRKQVATAGASKRLSKERLETEQKRYEAGLSQNYLVLERQQQLAQAELVEMQAIINYKRAIINLQKAMYTLLEANDFAIAKASSSNVPDLK